MCTCLSFSAHQCNIIIPYIILHKPKRTITILFELNRINLSFENIVKWHKNDTFVSHFLEQIANFIIRFSIFRQFISNGTSTVFTQYESVRERERDINIIFHMKNPFGHCIRLHLKQQQKNAIYRDRLHLFAPNGINNDVAIVALGHTNSTSTVMKQSNQNIHQHRYSIREESEILGNILKNLNAIEWTLPIVMSICSKLWKSLLRNRRTNFIST